ncbi:putative WD repeat-containing protein 79 [Rosellinia necatrix]|uniref:Putative WD repeat-containing protein 79 n=1 Tax=Rosellinia necatrix TaxID=77044 RepID=A0A1W2TDD6_ROSNE|nr:putative WD repeat-containing protein 79 [Rosellinia necatrix]
METRDEPSGDRVKLVASTGDIASGDSTLSSSSGARGNGNGNGSGGVQDDLLSYFENAQWTADGTTLLTYSSTNLISGYILPEDLLSANSALSLEPQARIQLPEPSNVLAGAPYFSLAEPWTQQLLVSARDHPLQLLPLAPSSSSSSPPSSAGSRPPISSYPFTKARSETFLAATSLLWPSPGTHFVAGSRNLLARFDVQRAGGEPLLRIRTIPSDRHLAKGGGVGMRGTVSALGAQPPDAGTGASLVAAGTWTRWVGLYDFAQAGKCAATWGIAAAARGTAAREAGARRDHQGPDDPLGGIGGDGITQTVWSPCGRYLLICERKSRGALIYDVRVTGKLLGYLTGRDALGNQRVACDVFPGAGEGGGFEVWSGTSSGVVKVWEGVGSREGPHAPEWEWAAHRSTVGSACLHPSGAVVATCAGSWEFPSEDEGRTHHRPPSGSGCSHSSDSEQDSDDSETDGFEGRTPWIQRRNKESSLKIWSITSLPSVAEAE